MEEERYPSKNSLKAEFYDTSHPDVDSSLEMHFREAEYSFKSGKYIEVTDYAILKMKKNGSWTVHEIVEASEIELFDDEELITVLIEKIVSKKETRKATFTLFALALIICIPVFVIAFTELGIGILDDVWTYILIAIIMAFVIPISCVIFSRSMRKIDQILYSTRSDFIQTLQKRADAEEKEYVKRGFVTRIERLKAQGTPYT